MEVVLSAVLLLIGLLMLCFGGNWLVSGGVTIAKKFRISNFVIGMTIVAYGTSTPELAASLAAAGDHGAIILGNIVGSNIANVGMVIGVAAILVPLAVHKSVLRKEIPIMLGVSALLVLLSIDGDISQYDGILLLIGLGIFVVYTFRSALKQREKSKDDTNPGKNNVYLKSIGLMGIGIILLYIGAILTVDNAVVIATEFGLSEKIIGLTVIAIRKGHSDIGIGNIIGSNIYNILMIMGVGASLGGVLITADVYVDYAIMIIFSLSLLIGLKTQIINRTVGVILAAGYGLYLITTFLK